MASAVLRSSLRSTLTLLSFTVIGTMALTWVYGMTRERIVESQEKTKLELIASSLPDGSFDNNLVRDAIPLPPHRLLGLRRPGKAYPARLKGVTQAVVLEAIAPDGYSGDITLLVAIRANGEIAGVRVAAHRETPGLGDYIDIHKSNWIETFKGRSLSNPPESRWKVRKDGGDFDTRTGATITPRAVVKAVHNALAYFEANRQTLLAGQERSRNHEPR
jgi:H+/Na+-translocating ferredoxin:NAD+ oxidoreductase subunit G